jgi:hypothetical protein
MLTPYDEFPVHQASRPFSYIPSTDYNWDDGYFFAVYLPDPGIWLQTGMRINANADMIGGYAVFVQGNKQFTLRLNRCWRREFDLKIGPLRYEVIEPLKTWRLVLEPNESGLEFDVTWTGASPAVLEEHHVATNRGRRTTDQSRYAQAGNGSGSIAFRGQTVALCPEEWGASRDHSWGLYAERPPLGPMQKWLPPRDMPGKRRALRFWSVFTTELFSGFYHTHEDENGSQMHINDVFATPFEGTMYRKGDDRPIVLKAYDLDMEFRPGTRVLKTARCRLTDDAGGIWEQEYTVPSMPWTPRMIGYSPGSWKDGGNFFTYHGSEELAMEWDDLLDISVQPMAPVVYGEGGEAALDTFGVRAAPDKPQTGTTVNAVCRTTSPDGEVSMGSAHLDFAVTGAYHPAGIAADLP